MTHSTFTFRRSLFAALFIMTQLIAAAQSPLNGSWNGVLDIMGKKLNLVWHIQDQSASLDSPDQGAKGIPAQVLFLSADSVALAVPALQIRFSGSLRDGQIHGNFSQGGFSLPLTLKPGEITRNRPQEPKPPFPYTTRELSFTSSLDGATLAGTLTLPENPENCPVVILINGSGQQNRDSEIFDHKPFAVIADRLARNGIASFRYDDRGIGQSQGARADITTETNAQDALDALMMVRNTVKAPRYGIIGHSEGAQIAFILAARHPSMTDFIVTLAAPTLKGSEILTEQIIYQASQTGTVLTPEQASQIARQQAATSPWLAHFLDYDPTLDIAQVKCPIFAAYGSFDLQVNPVDNASRLAFANEGRNSIKIKTYPGLNHLFQHTTTGSPEEYASLEETFSDRVITDIIDFILTANSN